MTTVRVPVDPGAEVIRTLPVTVWGHGGFPNFPAYQRQVDGEWVGTEDITTATHLAWDDHRLTFNDMTLIEAIVTNPERMPADTSTMTRADIEALYPNRRQPEVMP